MKDKKKKKKAPVKKQEESLSPIKKKIFLLITVSLPVIFFILLELSLRIFSYGGDLRLFIEGPEGYEEFLLCNPNVTRRYFSLQETVPTPPKQIIRKQKLKNTYRIFVLGESSTAGFPYGYNAAFPNVLWRGLQNTFPEKDIEVVTIATAAINTYSLFDLMDEIIEQSPDALLIYTGHNEYYGAMGVGSIQSVGSRWLTLTYLKLKSFKTFLLLRDFLAWAKNLFGKTFYGSTEADPSATLMARIVADQTIPYKSDLYEKGKEQFRENMNLILEKARENKIPVVLSELVSNLRDLPPFISVKDAYGNSAENFFNRARQYEHSGDFVKAKEYYTKAKDYDALRFRAPEDFNAIIKEMGEKYSYPVIPLKSNFENNSPNGLPGHNLILEHVHPNKDGYFLLAKAFYDAMKEKHLISSNWQPDRISEEKGKGFTELDSVHAALTISHLKHSWPFVPKALPNHFLDTYQPHNFVEQIAFQVLTGHLKNIEAGHIALGDYYRDNGQLDKAFNEYNAIVTSIPTEMDFYRLASGILITQQKFDQAEELLQKALKHKQYQFAYKWIGQIAFIKGNYKKAITYLEQADMGDAQAVFNLSRSYYVDNQWNKGEEYYNRLKYLAPGSDYLNFLTNLRRTTRLKLLQKQ